MKLYFTNGTCALAPHIALEEAGLPYTTEAVSFKTKQTASGADYLSVNPNGYVPALLLDTGEVLIEAAAILQYIADQVPDKKLAPANGTLERYKVQSWLNFISSELHKSYSVLFDRGAAEEWKQSARAHLAKRIGYVDTQLAGKSYLLGEQFSIADAYLFPVLSWSGHVEVDLTGFANVNIFLGRMAERPAVLRAKEAEAKK